MKVNGNRLVGQCEISHPVRTPNLDFSITVEEPWSPVDTMGEKMGKPHNVLFEAAGKDDYQPLDARIFSNSNSYLVELVGSHGAQDSITSTPMGARFTHPQILTTCTILA